MNSKLTITLALLISSAAFTQIAKADIIKCSFTEPFLSTEYSTEKQTLTVITPVSPYPKAVKTVIKNVSFQIKGPGLFELVGADKKVVQTLSLNNQGSDGMSDIVYPYDVKWNSRNLYGGCESDHLKRIEPKD